LIAAGRSPLVKLGTLNEVLPGESPDYEKEKKENIYNIQKNSFFIIIIMNMFSV
jgi:hypothetical protein